MHSLVSVRRSEIKREITSAEPNEGDLAIILNEWIAIINAYT